MDEALQVKYANHPLAQAILKDALAIQDRFAAEPVYARTGKGILRSAGVEEIKQARAADAKKKS
jgi:cation transport ATPase